MTDTPRTRFANVVNAADVPWQPWSDEKTGRYGGSEKAMAGAVGGKHLGYHLEILDPGKLSAPFHYHHHEEELFYVLEGRAILRQGNVEATEEIEVRPGDFIAFPAGTGIAHHFRNDSTEPFVFLVMSNKVPADVCEYPDSDKVLIRGTRLMLRRKPALDYWDG